MKNTKRFYILATLSLALSLTSCGRGGLKSYQSSPSDLAEIKKARIYYLGKKFDVARDMFKSLMARGVRTGDVLYYYAYALDFPGVFVTNVDGSETNVTIRNFKEITETYSEAVKWLNRYQSEFPEDNNQDKAMYNLGIMFYRPSSQRNLKRVKEFWDLGLRINPANPYIEKEYPNLSRQLEFQGLIETVETFLGELKNAKTVPEVESVASSYRSKVTKTDLSKYEKVVAVPAEVTEAIAQFDKLVESRKEEISRR
ncbi:MAG: hypothetical protein JNM63_05405 [Spirochaetia bacterium]|nr:hypothetical protein [Spirochaetia bacterium]